jgi:ribose-phosphate pyrophosphokinase
MGEERGLENLVIISATENNYFAREVAHYLKHRLAGTERTPFGDTDSKFRPDDNESIRGKDVYLISTHEPTVPERIHELIVWTDSLISASAKRLTIVLPYFIGGRQDRKTKRGEPVNVRAYINALKGVAQESAGNLGFLTGDLHSKQSQALAMDFDNLNSLPIFAFHIKSNYEDYVVVSPDAGGLKQAEDLAKLTNASGIAFVGKVRRPDGKSNHYGITGAELEGKTAIIVDDIIDSAGSLVNTVEAVREKGAKKVVVYATHLILSGEAEKMIKSFGEDVRIFGTDTVYHPDETLARLGIGKIPFSRVFAEAIRRKHLGESTKSLYSESVISECGLEYSLRNLKS